MGTDDSPVPGWRASAGVIHDIGYRPTTGRGSAAPQIALALCWHSLRSAFGIGRGAKAKIVPVIAFVIMCVPAVVNAVVDRARPVAHQGRQLRHLRRARCGSSCCWCSSPRRRPSWSPATCAAACCRCTSPGRSAGIDYPAGQVRRVRRSRCLAMIEIPLLLLYLGTSSRCTAAARSGTDRAAVPGLLVGLIWAVVLAASGSRWPAERPAGLLHRRGGDLLVPDLDAGQRADPRSRAPAARARPGGPGAHARRARAGRDPPVRPDQPVHRARRGAAVARRHQPGHRPDPGGYGSRTA